MHAPTAPQRVKTDSPLFVVFVLAALSLPYWINLGRSSLWDANESLYAETAREMLESGNSLAPTFNYLPRPHKPPLTYWAILYSYRLFGVSEFSARLPGALAAVGMLVFTFGIGAALFNVRAGLLATAVTALTLRIFLVARRLPIDIFLIFFLLGAAYFIVRGIQRRTTRHWALAYVCAGLGFMTKGPIALVIPAASLGIWLALNRKDFKGSVHPWVGALVLGGVVLPWHVLVVASQGWTYISPFFLKENLGRFAGEVFGPRRGLLFYVPVYLADFFPWSLLTFSAARILWIEREKSPSLRSLAFGFPLAWCGFTFVFFSLSQNKQEYYLAPVYPMMALVLAGTVERSLSATSGAPHDRIRPMWLRTFLGMGALGLLLSILPAIVLRSFIPGLPAMLNYAPSALFLLASAALVRNARRGNPLRCMTGIVVWLLAAYMLFCFAFVPAIEPFRPVKEMCRIIRLTGRAGEDAGYYRAAAPSMAFYLQRPIFEEYDGDAMVRRFRAQSRVFCILTEKDYDYFVGTRDLVLYVLDRRPRLPTNLLMLNDSYAAEQDLLLASNRPDPEAGTREGRETP